MHTSDVTGVDLHPTGKHVLTCSKDNSWALSDLATGETLGQVTDDDSSKGTSPTKSKRSAGATRWRHGCREGVL